ncbi:uncharacterized protein [Anabrus simplex]|uniref:uncharacterized protein n=1 Tax=Anabrus simplex TaxID=316456 RepID=UPI0034DDA582
MDMDIEIKDEPVWHEETGNDSLEKFKLVSKMAPLKEETKSELIKPSPTQDNAFEEKFGLVSEMVLLKQETKSELTEPGPAEKNTFEPSADSKREILVEQGKVDLLVPNIKEENNRWCTTGNKIRIYWGQFVQPGGMLPPYSKRKHL